MAERAIVDFQRGIRRWTSKGDIRGMSVAKWLKRDKIMEIRRFGSSTIRSIKSLHACARDFCVR